MYSLLIRYLIIVSTLFWAVNGFEIDADCFYRLGNISKTVSWSLAETLHLEFFISQNWKGNYYLQTKQDQTYEIELTFISGERVNYTNYALLTYEAFGWNNFSLKYEITTKEVLLSGYQIKTQGSRLTVPPDAKNNIDVTVKVQKPDFMYFFINCYASDERSFFIPGNKKGFILPVSFYMDRTRFVFYSIVDFHLILKDVYQQTGNVYLCNNNITRHNLATFPYCKNEFSKNTDYSWELSIADLSEGVIKGQTIKIESNDAPFYVKTNKSFKEKWWREDSESIQKSDYYMPMIIVSSVLSAILIAGVIIIYNFYRKKFGTPTAQGKISPEVTDLLQTFGPPPLPPFPRRCNPRGPESLNQEDGKDWKIYKPPPIGPAPAPPNLPTPLEDDGSITIVVPGYEEPDWWAEKYGVYENPKHKI